MELTATEYELLRALSINAGRVSTCNDLLRQVWDGRYYLGTDPVRAFIKKLRRKLGEDRESPPASSTSVGSATGCPDRKSFGNLPATRRRRCATATGMGNSGGGVSRPLSAKVKPD